MDRFLPSYCAVCFGIGTLTSWPASNNAALFAEVSDTQYPPHAHAFSTLCLLKEAGPLHAM